MAGANTLPMFHCLQPSTLRSYAQKSAAPPWLRSGEELPPANTAPILSTYRREHPPRFPQPTALHPPLTLSEIGRGRLGSARAWDDWGRREKYGNAVLATTDGQRRAQCPTSPERAKPSALDMPIATLKAVNTAPIFSTYRREHPHNLPQPAALHPPLTLSEIGRGRLGSARAWDDWGRREKYGNAVLATTDGQRRAQCPTSPERAKPSALDMPIATLKAVNTAPIFSTYRREHPHNLPQPAALHPPLTLSEIGRGRLGSARAWDDWGRREKYGNAVLATTDGQRRAQCPTSSERAKPYALKTQNAALKAGEHCALRCPDVGVSTHSIFLPPAAVPRPSGAKAAVADFVPLP